MPSDAEGPDLSNSGYLVAWEGDRWGDIMRLSASQVTSIGRAATNKLVLRDEVCSRNHCEIFVSGGAWVLRDLGSRNGTQVNGEDIEGDYPLEPGHIIQAGNSVLGFTDDLSHTLDEESAFLEAGVTRTTRNQGSDEEVNDDSSSVSILHRRRNTQLDELAGSEESRERAARELARLYRLGLEMGAAKTSRILCETVLSSLERETVADICAILLLPENVPKPILSDQLTIAAYRSSNDLPYRRVSDNLSQSVLVDAEAVLATDVSDDQQLAVFDSLGEMHAMSVICAPIRFNDAILGLVHLYSTNPDNPLDVDDLEFTLAVADQLGVSLQSWKERQSLETGLAKVKGQNQSLRQQLEASSELIGNSAAMLELRKDISLIAPTDATVLIRGESGVGKELISRSIHFESRRAAGPLVCMNCAALSESLLESELFGHEKGSFTGATDQKIGRFEQADGGTLFLDEVGEMSPSIQAKFLRVLEGHPFERIGGRKQIQVDVRVVAATNRDLEEAMEEGEFRKDLYFRLHVAEIHPKPLREHMDDIPVLADFFLGRFVQKTGRQISGFSAGAIDVLQSYHWPGNIRELQNTIERTVILCPNEVVRDVDIRLSSIAELDKPVSVSADGEYRAVSLAELEREHILATLKETEWNKSQAAQILGIERSTLDRKLKRYHVSRPGK